MDTPVATLTVEDVLKELRELFPNQVRTLHIYDAVGRLDVEILIDGVMRANAYNSQNGLTEAMAKVRT